MWHSDSWYLCQANGGSAEASCLACRKCIGKEECACYLLLVGPGGVKDHTFVNRNINYIFGILTSRAIDWYINESILRGSGGGGVKGGAAIFVIAEDLCTADKLARQLVGRT